MAFNILAAFCEDIREEKSGQVTLVGMMPDNISVPRQPEGFEAARAIIPKLALYVRAHMTVDENVAPFGVKLVLPDASEVDLGTVDQALLDKSKVNAKAANLPIAGIVHHAVIQGFTLPKLGLIRAVVTFGNGEQCTCGVLNVLAAKT